MRRYTVMSIGIVAMTLLSIPMSAQSFPCVLTGPNVNPNVTAITTGSWAFKLAGFSVVNTGSSFVGAVGTFTAAIGTTARSTIVQGVLTSTISINLGGTMYTVLMPVAGNWQLDPGPNGDCTSGTLLLANGSTPASVRSVRFVLQSGGSKMYLTSADNDGMILTGAASRQ